MQIIEFFNNQATRYSADYFATYAMQQLWHNLNFMQIKPEIILDAGCGNGRAIFHLQKLYPQSKILACDKAKNMLQKIPQTENLKLISTDISQFYYEHKIDFILANLLWPWCNLRSSLISFQKATRENALLLFSYILPMSQEKILANSWDMHNIADLMINYGFAETVIQSERQTLVYDNLGAAQKEFFDSGLSLLFDVNQYLYQIGSKWHLDVEFIYGHSWRNDAQYFKSADGNINIPFQAIKKK